MYKRQVHSGIIFLLFPDEGLGQGQFQQLFENVFVHCNRVRTCLLYTSDAADERSSVDLGGRRIIKKKKKRTIISSALVYISIYTGHLIN